MEPLGKINELGEYWGRKDVFSVFNKKSILFTG